MRDIIKDILLESIQVKEEIMRTSIEQIIEISNLLMDCIRRGGKIIFFGNGGSAADSQHIAAELVGRFRKDRTSLPAIALTVNTSVITSLSNDYSYEIIFAKQIEALGKPEDVAVGISTSGKAKNVIAGIRQAKKMGLKTIVLTGGDGGSLVKTADVSFIVPSNITARIQEAHITVAHVICQIIEEKLFKT